MGLARTTTTMLASTTATHAELEAFRSLPGVVRTLTGRGCRNGVVNPRRPVRRLNLVELAGFLKIVSCPPPAPPAGPVLVGVAGNCAGDAL